MIAAKVKQMTGMDTMLLRCAMQDKEGDEIVLIDERGCRMRRWLVKFRLNTMK